jgi:hypothetical protein
MFKTGGDFIIPQLVKIHGCEFSTGRIDRQYLGIAHHTPESSINSLPVRMILIF